MSTTFKNYEKTQITNAKEKREALLQAWQILKGQQTIIKTFPGRNLLLLVIFLVNSIKNIRDTLLVYTNSQKVEEAAIFPNSFCEMSITLTWKQTKCTQ